MSKKPLRLLLIEDNQLDCNNFINHAKTRNDVEFIGLTDSDIQGLELVKTKKPDAIILDLELTKGSGNPTSFNFIKEVNSLMFDIKPKIIVTTVVSSESVYNFIHENGVDLIFYKKQSNYSPKHILDTLVLLSDFSNSSDIPINFEDPDAINKRISDKISTELNLIGISPHLKGRKYIHDAIFLILSENNTSLTINQHLMNKYKKASSTITRAMQNAILHAWRISAIEDLEKLYTAKINYETGIPTPMEFIYYYADKIKKFI